MSGNGKNTGYRASAQYLLPLTKNPSEDLSYDIYPSFKIPEGEIDSGFDCLAEKIIEFKTVMIDGYPGVFFEQLISGITRVIKTRNYSLNVIYTYSLLKTPEDISVLTAPFLGEGDPLFGFRCDLDIKDFFLAGAFDSLIPDADADINIIAGPGAALARWAGKIIYADIPKNEIQFRARAGSITNFGIKTVSDPSEMYKFFYFVEWIVQNKHKKAIINKTDIYLDCQRPDIPVFIEGETLRRVFNLMCRSPFRARPWFEPGAWGGKWILNNIHGISDKVRNYAWSFELITPENGILIESSSLLLEVSFDCLMYLESESVLGDCSSKYGTDFPIRFDFLDTYEGGNLSIQCHPRPDYIRTYFGEPFTQEESYYILDNKDNSSVFLGFRDDIDPLKFRQALEESHMSGKEIDPDIFILRHPSRKHDLFLIPYGTIHGSGKNNLVLEISTTPYIFTFKMYDWLRPDLNGKPRVLNIARGMANLLFDRKGKYVTDNLISRPVIIDKGPDWKLYDLPTHISHSYKIHRYHFRNDIKVRTGGRCLVMSLTEGKSISVVSKNGRNERYSFAETFIIPAAAESVQIFNNSGEEAVLVLAFIK